MTTEGTASCEETIARSAVRADPDSRARTHLANQRTFLAWLRTGLALLGLALAGAQFLSKSVVAGVHLVTVMALGLAGCGIFVALAGAFEYTRARRAIDQGRYRAVGYMIVATSAVVVLVGLVAMAFIVLVRGGG